MALKKSKDRNSKYEQGFYKPQNPEKYVGNLNEIYYRSRLEKKFAIYCDTNPLVSKWGLEILYIPYQMVNENNRMSFHKYYPDFYVELTDPENPLISTKMIVEIKPKAETVPPTIPNTSSLKKLKSLEYQVMTYRKNVHKWAQAIDWCKRKGMIFKIVTEENINTFVGASR